MNLHLQNDDIRVIQQSFNSSKGKERFQMRKFCLYFSEMIDIQQSTIKKKCPVSYLIT